MILDAGPLPGELLADGEMVQDEIGGAERLSQQIGIERSPRVAALPCGFHA
jgi:hypothetical protein